MKQLKSFTIDRKVWLRGESGRSMLYRPEDGKMCCLGILMSKCGVPKSVLANRAFSDEIAQEYPKQLPPFLSDFYSTDVLMLTNDKRYLSEEKREAIIKEAFKEVGIKVRFKG
jgi:hypothetical protein